MKVLTLQRAWFFCASDRTYSSVLRASSISGKAFVLRFMADYRAKDLQAAAFASIDVRIAEIEE